MPTDTAPAPIVVGILDPEVETALLEYAGRLAATSGHPLRLVHVVQANVLFGDPILGLPGAMQPQSMIIDDAGVGRLAEQLLAEATAVARDVVAGAVEVSSELLRGHAAHVLIEESEDAHRVVVQRRGFSRIHRIFTGSISSRIAAHAHCPVVVGRASHLNAFPHLGGVTRALLREAGCPVEVLPLPN